MKTRLIFTALALTLASFPAAAQFDTCANWADFETLGKTQMEIEGAPNASNFELYGRLIYRPLLIEEDSFWLGFELYTPESYVNGEIAESAVYSVPFAVKIEEETGYILDYRFNARLEYSDQSKLRSIYQALHISLPPVDSNAADYLVKEIDDMGAYQALYQVIGEQLSKRKQEYTEVGLSETQSNVFQITEVQINQDETIFDQDQCWHTEVVGNSDLQVFTAGNAFNVRSVQSLKLERRRDSIAADSLLMQLPLNPEDWQLLSVDFAYPKPERNPETTGDLFLQRLAGLDLTLMESEAILQYLYDNEEYIPLLKGPIGTNNYSDENERRLFLMVGINDSPNSHWLLSEIFVDETIDPQARFRGLMAIKYAKQPIDSSLVEQIFFYASQDLADGNAELAHSAMMTMGIIARTQLDSDFGRQLSDRIALELRSTVNSQKSAALLSAIGNTGDAEQQYLVADYLVKDDALLRARSAEALAKMPNARTLTALSSQLTRESDASVEKAILRSMGANQLKNSQLNQVYEYAQSSNDGTIRLAAIEALAMQVEHNVNIKTELRSLLKTEKAQVNMQTILGALY